MSPVMTLRTVQAELTGRFLRRWRARDLPGFEQLSAHGAQYHWIYRLVLQSITAVLGFAQTVGINVECADLTATGTYREFTRVRSD